MNICRKLPGSRFLCFDSSSCFSSWPRIRNKKLSQKLDCWANKAPTLAADSWATLFNLMILRFDQFAYFKESTQFSSFVSRLKRSKTKFSITLISLNYFVSNRYHYLQASAFVPVLNWRLKILETISQIPFINVL